MNAAIGIAVLLAGLAGLGWRRLRKPKHAELTAGDFLAARFANERTRDDWWLRMHRKEAA